MKNTTKTNLEELINEIKNGELLLPDFQRGFVWRVETQKKLVASVLARMPIGSILGLEAEADDYGCRILGRKDEPNISGEGTICILLDGQQRMTALTNIFSNLLFYDYEGSGKLICDYNRIASTDLQYRFFLEIPSIENMEKEEDFFDLYHLKLHLDNSTNATPKFLTRDILKYIRAEAYTDKSTEEFVPHTETPGKITKYCIQDDCYLIPLYLLINNSENDTNNETRLNYILKKIVEEVVQYRLVEEFDSITNQEDRITYVMKVIELDDDIEEIITDKIIDRGTFERKWEEQGKIKWAQKMFDYLKGCIQNLDLHQIKVSKSDRNRAIDIYENLNMGGVTLSTFELVLAKAAKKKNEGNKNLFQLIVEYIQESKDYAEGTILPDKMKSAYQEFRKREEDYSATETMACFDDKKNQLSSKYTDVFLNVLSLLCYTQKHSIENIETALIKRDKILELTADEIMDNYKQTCIGIDRACFFLQTRCGVRKIQEVNYNLLLVLLGYVLANDEYYKDESVSRLLEAWYWTVIFSGRYDKDQTSNIIDDIKKVIGSIKSGDTIWLSEMKKNVFDMQDFSDENTMLLKTPTIPKSVLRKAICQFYLSINSQDLMTDEKLNPFSKSAGTLEEHHIVPIGSLKNNTYKKMEKEKRNDKRSVFNSPLNFALITKESNLMISNKDIEAYIKHCNDNSLYSLQIEVPSGKDELDKDTIELVLEKRFVSTKQAVLKRIDECI